MSENIERANVELMTLRLAEAQAEIGRLYDLIHNELSGWMVVSSRWQRRAEVAESKIAALSPETQP